MTRFEKAKIEKAIAILTEEFARMEATATAAVVVGGRENWLSKEARQTTGSCWLIVEALRWAKGESDTAFGAYISQVAAMHRRSRQRRVLSSPHEVAPQPVPPQDPTR